MTEKVIERVRRKEGGGVRSSPSIQLTSTGCTLLDLIIGGGWAQGRVANLIGDSSTGKTLLAIEAAANYRIQFPKGRIWYREAEHAFDRAYAEDMGMPKDVKYWPTKEQGAFRSVEQFYDDLSAKTDWLIENKREGLYIVDSLDALTDERETKKDDIRKADFKVGKAAVMSELFRKLCSKIEQSQMTVIIISQVRDNIGAMFGNKHTRAGGNALTFYCSQIVWLSHLETIRKERHGHRHSIGIRVKAKCTKNKVFGRAHETCEFTIRFGYGVDNLAANLQFLLDAKRLKNINLNEKLAKEMMKAEDVENYKNWDAVAENEVRKLWCDIEYSLRPKRKKYGN